MISLGTPLRTTCPQMGALIHTDRGLIHTQPLGEIAGILASFWPTWLLGGVEHLPESPDVTPEVVVLGHLALDLFATVEHGRVTAAAERRADPQKWRLGLLAHEVHRDLARKHDLLVARLPLELPDRHAVVLRDDLDDLLGRERLLPGVVEDVLQDLLRELGRDRHRVERGVSADARERALELADVRDDALREEV